MTISRTTTDHGDSREERMTVFAADASVEKRWIAALRAVFGEDSPAIEGSTGEGAASAPIVFVDFRHPRLAETVRTIAAGADRRDRSVFLILQEDDAWSWDHEIAPMVDDVLVHPFRASEVEGKIRLHHHLRLWGEVHELNASFQEVLRNLGDDVELAARLQKAKQPMRFPDVKGLRIHSRYQAGMKSGGDHFDVAESRTRQQVSVLLSDSSSYGLSSNFISTLMRVAMKLSQDESRKALETVRLIFTELSLGLKEKDRLSLFYGVLSRKDYVLRYLNLGSAQIFHAPKGRPFRRLPHQGEALQSGFARWTDLREEEIALEPSDRLILLSDGYVDGFGGEESVLKFLNGDPARDPKDVLNEFVFSVKRRIPTAEDLPEQDCSALIIDVDSKVIRLAS